MKMGTIASPCAMMPRPAMRSNWQVCDGLRSCATTHGRLPDFGGWPGYPPIAALSINPEIDVMGHNPTRPLFISLCRSLCDFAGAVTEKLRDRAEVRGLQVTTPFGTRAIGRRTADLISERMAGIQCGSRENRTKRPLATDSSARGGNR